MARRRKRRGGGQTPRGRKPVKVKGHTRSPRGPNRGKRAVRVKGYVRKKPRR